MAITAELVRDLRERTGAGMMDCKRVLGEADGDIERAIELLRERGLASAAKKAGRVASEGLVAAYVAPDGKVGSLIEVNCETDFVARNDEFQAFVAATAEAVATAKPGAGMGEGQDIAALPLKGGEGTVGERLTALIAKIGENMAVRRYVWYEVAGPGRVDSYIHMGGRIGVLVSAEAESDAVASSEAFRQTMRDLTMQVAAAKPDYVKREDVSADVVEREMSIYRTQAANEGKPAQIQDKIAQGKLDKFFKDTCLIEQAYIRDPDRAVSALIKEREKEAGGSIRPTAFTRFERGEGLAKREE